MSNVLNEEKRNQVVALGRMGWSLRRIQESTGIRRETAAGYLKTAGIAVRKPGGWGKRPAADSKPANGVTTDFGGGSSTCEPYRELIDQALGRGRNAMSIWQQLVDQYGFTGAYESVANGRVRARIRLWRRESASSTVMRMPTPPRSKMTCG